MFFLGHLVLGVFLGMAASRAIRWRRFHHGFHGGCGRFGGWHRSRFGMGGPAWLGGGPGAFFFFRDLGFSSTQMRALKEAWLKGRNAIAGMRASNVEGFHALVQAALADPVDRAELDATARRFTEDQGQGARDLVEALDAALAVLTPEQKDKLRARFGRFGADFGVDRGPFGPGGGPYRM